MNGEYIEQFFSKVRENNIGNSVESFFFQISMGRVLVLAVVLPNRTNLAVVISNSSVFSTLYATVYKPGFLLELGLNYIFCILSRKKSINNNILEWKFKEKLSIKHYLL